MKITQVRLGRISTPLRVPFKTALRTVNSVEDVIVELHTDTGAVGYGEAPPTGVITGDTAGAIIGAIQDHIAPAILGRDLDEFEDLTAAVQKALVHNTSAKAAVDMALWDLLGQKYSAPVYRMLGGARRNIVTDITISVNPPEEMARDARTAVQRGYDCLKVKVGIDPELDVARLAAVRQAVGRDITERKQLIDALRASENRFRQLFEQHSAIMFLVDPHNGRILDANPAAARFYGYPRETLRQMVAADVGITLLPTLAVKPPVARSSNIHLLGFSDSHPSRRIAMVWRKSSAMSGFRQVFAQVFRDLPPGLFQPDAPVPAAPPADVAPPASSPPRAA